MTPKELEMLRPWLDAEQRPTDAGYRPERRLVAKGFVLLDFDQFYKLTDYGKNEAEKLIGRPL